jgi:hypothetical protein
MEGPFQFIFNRTPLSRKNIVFIVIIVRSTINQMRIMKTNICKSNQYKKIRNPIKLFLIILLIIKTSPNAVSILISAFNDYLYYLFFHFYFIIY